MFVGTVLLVVLGLALAPYLAGKDFGPFRIPEFSSNSSRILSFLGPVLLLVLIAAFVPLIPEPGPPPPPTAEVDPSPPIDELAPDSAVADLRGQWNCTLNNARFKSELVIETQAGDRFEGVDTVLEGTCCVGVVSAISNGIIDGESISFQRNNNDLPIPQTFLGKLINEDVIAGTILDGAQSDFQCFRANLQ